MSLSVYLFKKKEKKCPHCGEVVKTKEKEVFYANTTHNLAKMASEVKVDEHSLYEYLWRPEEINITNSSELIKPLSTGLEMLLADSDYYKQFNSENGWGTYEGFTRFVFGYLDACKANPNLKVYVSR